MMIKNQFRNMGNYITNNYIKETDIRSLVQPCGWWFHNITITGYNVSFCVAIAGNSYSVALKGAGGATEASLSDFGNGCLTAYTLTATTSGPHTLELTCGWNIQNPCEVCNIEIPTPNTGRIHFIVKDSLNNPINGSSVYLDGSQSSAGSTNATGEFTTADLSGSASPGTPHSYIITKSGFIDASGTVNVIAGQTIDKNVVMTTTPTTGTIHFIVSDEYTGNLLSGVSITIDGHNGMTDLSGVVDIPDLPISNIAYTYIATKSGYNTYTGSKLVNTSNVTELVHMTSSPVQAGFGGSGMILIAGLAVGALVLAMKKPKI